MQCLHLDGEYSDFRGILVSMQSMVDIVSLVAPAFIIEKERQAIQVA